jgi:hypothetical protein
MDAKQLFFQAVLGAMGLYGCAFEPHEEFVSPIKPPEAITVTFELNDPVLNDPYYLIEPTNFHIILQDTNYPLIGSEVTVNGSEIPSWVENNRDLYFLLDPYQIASGYHTVLVRCYLDTKSGSLANIVGAENYLVDQTFEVRIDPTPPSFDSFRAVVENGFLTFKWNNKTNQQNFVYTIQRKSRPYLPYPDSVITDGKLNQFIDYGYIGGNLDYRITAKGFRFETAVGEGSFYHKSADFTISHDSTGITSLAWTNKQFAGENHELHIKPQYYFSGERRVPFTPSGKVDLEYYHFAQLINLNVEFYSLNNISRKHVEVVEYIPKPTIKPFTFFRLLGKSNKLLIGNLEMLYRYNLGETIQLEDSLRFTDLGLTHGNNGVIVSPDESRIYISGKWENIHESKFLSLNPHNFDNIQPHVMNSILGSINFPTGGNYPLVLGNVSNNGLITMWTSGRSLLFDISKQKVMWSNPRTLYRPPAVSPDGRFLAANINGNEGWVFEVREGVTHPLGRIDSGFPIYLNDGGEIMTALNPTYRDGSDGTAISVFDLTNPPEEPNLFLTRIRSDEMPSFFDLYRAFYDPVSGYIAFSYSDRLKLYNVNSMGFEKTYPGYFFYVDKYLLYNEGFIFPAP